MGLVGDAISRGERLIEFREGIHAVCDVGSRLNGVMRHAASQKARRAEASRMFA
jgi:hypothetical protein